jgi:hypothetical protein
VEPVRAGLIQRVEDEFGISVPEDEAVQIHTAGDLHALLVRKLSREEPVLFPRALYLTRRALAEGLGVPRKSIAPETRLRDLVPSPGRVECWNAVVRSAGGHFPRLRHSRSLQDRVMLASMVLATPPVIALWWALYALDWIRGIGVLLFSMPAALAFLLLESRLDKHLLRATARWANDLPCETVRELAQEMVEMNPAALHPYAGEGKLPSSDEVWGRVTALIHQGGEFEAGTVVPGTAIPETERVN